MKNLNFIIDKVNKYIKQFIINYYYWLDSENMCTCAYKNIKNTWVEQLLDAPQPTLYI